MAQVVAGWDAKNVVNKLELQVGRDERITRPSTHTRHTDIPIKPHSASRITTRICFASMRVAAAILRSKRAIKGAEQRLKQAQRASVLPRYMSLSLTDHPRTVAKAEIPSYLGLGYAPFEPTGEGIKNLELAADMDPIQAMTSARGVIEQYCNKEQTKRGKAVMAEWKRRWSDEAKKQPSGMR